MACMPYTCPELKIHRQYTANNNMSLLHHKSQYFLNEKTTLSRSHTNITTQEFTRFSLGFIIISITFIYTNLKIKHYKS